ncbi:MAG: OmpA family protein [Paludibacteraceae bacterium]|nr:OmpA family protein [Paludibacteraceae bacterium]
MRYHLHIALSAVVVLMTAVQSRAEVPANVREEFRMTAPLVTDRQEQHETLPQVAASADSLVRVTTKYLHTYIDTIRVVRYSEDSIPRTDTIITFADSTDRKGHYVQAYIGGGYGSIGFRLAEGHGGKVSGFATGRVQAQYAYFFHPNWGIGAGLWFENLSSTASLANGMDYTDFVFLDRIDTNGEPHYNHTARVYGWKERATLYNLAIPVSLQTQWWNEAGELGIFGAIGVAPAFAVVQNYRLIEGDVEHYGVYPNWGLTLDGMADHEYARNTDNPDLYTAKPTAKGKMEVSPMATVFAEVGALVNLTRQLDMMIGLYGHFTPNNVVTETLVSQYLPADAGEDAPPFGWGPEQRVGPTTFMDEYKGLYATSLREGKTYPWAVGLKIGLHWHHFDKPKSHTEQNYDYFFRPDTTYRTVERLETEVVERIDTFKRAPKLEIKLIQKKVDKLNKIYFAFDSYSLNNKSKKYLRDIYAILKEVPNHIIIGGHASEEGQVEYNEQLALHRATAVKNYLVQLGIPEPQLEVKNYGARVANEERVDNNISLDRRVEIIIVE